MFPKRLLPLTLFAALAVMPTCVLHAQWVQCNGPGGSSILTLATLGPYVFAGTSGDGLLRSTNNGASWSHDRLGNSNADVAGIAIDDSQIYIASDSLYYSSDSGWTWQASMLPGQAGSLAILGSYLILASFDGVFRTSDRGATWDEIGSFYAVSVVVENGNLYVGRYTFGLSVSTDSGETWSTIDGDNSIMDGASIQSLASAGDDVYAGGYYDEGFFRSTDKGITWDTSDIGLPNRNIPNRIEDNFVTILALFQDNDRLLAGSSEGMFLSNDSGLNWTTLSSMNADAFTRSGNNLLAGTTVGIWISTDSGITWNPSNQGMNAGTVSAIASIGTHIFISIQGTGLFRSDDSGTTWVGVTEDTWGGAIDGFVVIDTSIFAFAGRDLYKSSDAGNSWDSLTKPGYWPAAAFGSSLFTCGYGSFYFSTDYGALWDTTGSWLGSSVSCLLPIGTDIFAGTATGDCSSVSLSTDTGTIWTYLNFIDECTDVSSLSYDSSYIYCGTSVGINSSGAGVLRRSLQDTAWSAIDTGLPDLSQDGVSTIVGSRGNMFLGTFDSGVFHSTNAGNNWIDASAGLSTGKIVQLAIIPPYIFAGTWEDGVWRRPLSDFGISSVAQPPASTKPEIQIYPNPFSQSTQITFTSQSAGYAEVSIVNMLGVEVARLFSGVLGAYEHSFLWGNPTGLPDGAYQCLVRMNGQMQTLPIVLMR
jgi:hypothetical protein